MTSTHENLLNVANCEGVHTKVTAKFPLQPSEQWLSVKQKQNSNPEKTAITGEDVEKLESWWNWATALQTHYGESTKQNLTLKPQYDSDSPPLGISSQRT